MLIRMMYIIRNSIIKVFHFIYIYSKNKLDSSITSSVDLVQSRDLYI